MSHVSFKKHSHRYFSTCYKQQSGIFMTIKTILCIVYTFKQTREVFGVKDRRTVHYMVIPYKKLYFIHKFLFVQLPKTHTPAVFRRYQPTIKRSLCRWTLVVKLKCIACVQKRASFSIFKAVLSMLIHLRVSPNTYIFSSLYPVWSSLVLSTYGVEYRWILSEKKVWP